MSISQEVLMLFGTSAVARYFADDDKLIFWLIFVATTRVRWLWHTAPSSTHNTQMKPRQLFADMCYAHERLKTAFFDPRLFQHLLYELETHGAVFSPHVYNLLDRRNARETDTPFVFRGRLLRSAQRSGPAMPSSHSSQAGHELPLERSPIRGHPSASYTKEKEVLSSRSQSM